jgi:hypothetical protein
MRASARLRATATAGIQGTRRLLSLMIGTIDTQTADELLAIGEQY